MNYYKQTQKLMFAYPKLINHMHALSDRINDLKMYGVPKKSKDIVKFSASGGEKTDESAILEQYIQTYSSRLNRITQDILWIDYLVTQIKDKNEKAIIKKRYFDEMTIEELAEELELSERTIRRKNKKAINTISILIFGSTSLGM